MCSMHKDDRISSLHDSILSHILSFLSTKEAVATSILAHRWRFVWTTVPVIDLDVEVEMEEELRDEKKIQYMNFVTNVLLLNKEPCLRYCRLTLPYRTDSLHASAWIENIVKRSVKEIDLKDCTNDFRSSVFTCEKVEILTCRGYFCPKPMSVHLPNLCFLKLSGLVFTPSSFMAILTSSCHALRELVIDGGAVEGELCVSSSSLKKLLIRETSFVDLIVIDAPSLEYLMISLYYPVQYDVKYLSSLREADIDLPISSNVLDFPLKAHILEFVNSLANSTTLQLRTSPRALHTMDGPFGEDLPYLELPDVLDRTPNLVHLIIKCHLIEISKDPESYNMTHVPSCLLCGIKVIEIREFDGSEGAMEMVSYLLLSAKVLNEMRIYWVDTLSPVDKNKIYMKLMSFLRGSSACRVIMSSTS